MKREGKARGKNKRESQGGEKTRAGFEHWGKGKTLGTVSERQKQTEKFREKGGNRELGTAKQWTNF